jgi:hypothetical protein
MANNNIFNLEGKNLWDLQNLLKNLKLYKDLTKKLGNRWKKLFDSITNNKSIYKVEYFDAISEEQALQEALMAFKKVFGEEPKKEDIVLKKKSSLEGWIRIFKDDNLVDLSFKKVEKSIL